jgi:hypothetical protein
LTLIAHAVQVNRHDQSRLKTLCLIENAWQNPRSSTHAQRLGIVTVCTN